MQNPVDDLRRRLEATERELAALRDRSDKPARRRRVRSRRWAPLMLVALLLALVPAALGASDRFDDVPEGAFYHDDASAIAEAGVTLGCGDGSNYCPNAFVTRGEMAAFLARLGGLGDNDPVANAATAQALSAEGATAGQVLTATGTGAEFRNLPAGGTTGAPTPTIRTSAVTIPGGATSGTATASCQASEVITGGGYQGSTAFLVAEDYPSSIRTWTVNATNFSNNPPADIALTVYALCVPAAP